jgi:uncharacterized protein (TIGR02246 family)
MNSASAAPVVERIEALWSDASLKGDVDSILALYTEDALFFGSLPRLFVGRQGIREYFDSVPLSAARGITFFDRQVRILNDDAIATASYVYFDLELKGELVRWRFGISWTLINHRRDWKIASHHASPREIAK